MGKTKKSSSTSTGKKVKKTQAGDVSSGVPMTHFTPIVPVSADSDFSMQNLPYGIFSRVSNGELAVGTRLGDTVFDVSGAVKAGLLYTDASAHEQWTSLLTGPAAHSLNALMATGPETWSSLRRQLQQLLGSPDSALAKSSELRSSLLLDADSVTMHLPVAIGDFTDFYASKEHATNVGTMFRDPKNALLPNWKHIPVGYSGRASSVVVSGVPVTRPKGQTVKAEMTDEPAFVPCRLLDFELEMGFFVGTGNQLGEPIRIADARKKLFGMVLLNDWSARDIQKYYYVPLGPSLGGKSFATSISPWVVTMEALEPFRTKPPTPDLPLQSYLVDEEDAASGTFDIELTVDLIPKGTTDCVQLTKSNYKYLYYTAQQMLTHYASSGTNMRTGDLLGSGTISGPTKDSRGSMLEITWRGTEPVKLPNGEERKFIADGDEVVLRGYAQGDGYRVGFGECRNLVVPAPEYP